MSDATASLHRKIGGAGDLQSVVRTMKTMAASIIGQYEQSVRALRDYYRTVELGLGFCFRGAASAALMTGETRPTDKDAIGAVVFGSDQGLVGQFDDVVADLRPRHWRSYRPNSRSGPSMSVFMCAWRMRACL